MTYEEFVRDDKTGVDYEIVWKVVKERLPEVKPLFEKMLEELEGEEGTC